MDIYLLINDIQCIVQILFISSSGLGCKLQNSRQDNGGMTSLKARPLNDQAF